LNWRQDRALSGNNVMMLGIIYEALIRWVGAASSVMAMGKISTRSRRRGNQYVDVHIPDHLDVIAHMDCGAQAHLQFSSISGLMEHSFEIWLFGMDGTLTLAPYAPTPLRGGKRGQSLKPIDVPASESQVWRVEEEFVNAIRGYETIKLTTFADGVRYMEFTDAVHESLISGEQIAVAQ